ncbi:MAG: hypothetical protein RSA93_04145 [Longicatena sp.]
MKMNENVLLKQTDAGMELIAADGRSKSVPEKDLWLVKRLLAGDVSTDELLTLITQSTKEEYPLVNFTLVQFIVDYDGYLDTKDQSINKIGGQTR